MEIPGKIWRHGGTPLMTTKAQSILLGASRTQGIDNGVYANQAQKTRSAEQQDINWNYKHMSANKKQNVFSTKHRTESFGADPKPVATDLRSCVPARAINTATGQPAN